MSVGGPFPTRAAYADASGEPSTLDLLVVRVLAAVGLSAGAVGFVLSSPGRHRAVEAPGIVAARTPARWTVILWIGGTLAILLWPAVVLVAPTYGVSWPGVPEFLFSAPLQVFGFLLGVLGGLLFFTAARALGRHLTPAIQVQAGHQLVQGGPYRYIRHPIYTANLTVATGWTLLFLSPPLGVLTLLMVGIAVYRARLEEELLRSPAGFGKTYDEYMSRTGRFLPRPRSRTN